MPPLAFCGECGQKLLEGKPFCGECGHNNAGGVVAPAKTGGGGGGGSNVGGKGKVCGGCQNSLEGVLRYTSALDKEWHLECFVCAKCRSDFNGGKFFVQDGMPICDNCTRNTGPKCAGCNQPCGEKYIGALDKMWHHACFVCSGCSKPLSGGVGFISRNERPYCDASCANRTSGGNQVAAARPVAQTSAVSPIRPTSQVSAANVVKSQTSKPAETSCFACSRNAGKAFCPECGKKLGGVVANPNQQREQQQQQQREQQQREQQQREQQQREQQQREQQQREQQQREQQQREQRQREQQQREQQQKDQREREQQQKRDQQQQPKPQATPTKNLFCGECGTKLAGPGFCPECGHNNGAPVSVSRPATVKSYQQPDSPEAPPMAPGGPPMAPGAPPMAPGAPPMALGGPPMAPSAPSGYGAPGGKAPAGRGDLLAQINAGKKLKKAPKVAERGADGLPVGFTEGGSSAGGSAKKPAAAAGGGRGGPMDMQAQLAAKLAARNK